MNKRIRAEELRFRPRARLLLLLGDQLIRDPGIAVFELVKNSYDADATDVSVTMTSIDHAESGTVIVEDNGSGMTWDIVTRVWLEPGTDYREQIKNGGGRSPRYNRLPLGEKGIGRFAAHKLGLQVTLITRAADSPEVVVELDWRRFQSEEYLDEALVPVSEREPRHFTGHRTGTRIEVTLLGEPWTRAMVRQVHRAVTAISSPFGGPSDFRVSFSVQPHEEWVSDLLDVESVLNMALYSGSCTVLGDRLTYTYEFTPPAGMDRIEGRRIENREVPLGSIVGRYPPAVRGDIGPLRIDLRIFDLDPQVLRFGVSDRKGLREFMRNNGGMRVFRDQIRVFDYGEPGNDWLGLGTRRVNVPAQRLSNNQIIGAVHLDGELSRGLVEKTNREGFVEDEAFDLFREITLFTLAQIEAERNQDKARIRLAYSGPGSREPVTDRIAELRDELARREIMELEPLLGGIEKEFREVRDKLMVAANAGLTVSMVIHEVEKGIGEITKAVRRNAPIDELRPLAEHLSELVEGLTYLTRRSGRRAEKASTLVRQALFNLGYRTRAHRIEVINGLLSSDRDFETICSRRLIIAILMNLLDNAIYWLVNKGGSMPTIYIGTSRDLDGGPAIVVADNGPGFQDPPEFLTQAFNSRRPDGMGLGLHLADEVMRAHDGQLVFPERGDIKVPEQASGGAIVALQFRGQR